MAWSDAARRAAALARKRIARRMVKVKVTKAGDYLGSVRTQRRSIESLAKAGRDPRSGRKVGVKRARRIASDIGDWAND